MFPAWVALVSLGLVLWLYYSGTAPAAREREELVRLQTELLDLRDQLEATIAAVRLGRTAGATWDLQSLLVAIDQRGYTPAELCAAFPAADQDLPTPPGRRPRNR
jgi:hypothetical protein